MTDAKRDQNRVTVLLGVSNVDGVTPTPVYVNPVSHAVLVSGASDGLTPVVGTKIKRDSNRVPVGRGVSSADGTTPLPYHVDPTTKRLLVSNA